MTCNCKKPLDSIKIVKTRDVKSPIRAHSTDAGIDFFIPNDYDATLKTFWDTSTNSEKIVNDISIGPLESICIPSGIKMIIPDGFAGIFMNKSGIGKEGIVIGACVIDSSYRGEVHIDLHNISRNSYVFKPGQKIAQMLIMPIDTTELQEISEDEFNKDQTDRGSGGFGSTGK